MRKFYLLYFAESGRLKGFYSELRKAFGRTPEPLLEITHDVMGDFRLSWLEAVDKLGVPVEYYFRDEVPERLNDWLHTHHVALPAVVGLSAAGGNVLVASADDLKGIRGQVEMLVEKLQNVLKTGS